MSANDDMPGGTGNPDAEGLISAAQGGVREVVAEGDDPGKATTRWVAPLAAAATVAAAACAPVVWPLLSGGAQVGSAVVSAALGQVGALGGGLLSEVVIRVWDRMRGDHDADIEQADLREALAAELGRQLGSASRAGADLRADVARVLRRVDAVRIALMAVDDSVRQSGDQVRDVLVRGLRDLGIQFAEFGWLVDEIGAQLTRIAESQVELAAGSRAMLEAQERTLMQLALLYQQTRATRSRRARPAEMAAGGRSKYQVLDLEPDDAGPSGRGDCPYPGLAAYGPDDAERFFGRSMLTATLVARIAEQLTRPGLLMVVGPSGSGKSSALRAGLLPAIAAGGLPAQGAGTWPVELMTPGRRPLLELAARIAGLAGVPAGALEADLRADPDRIVAIIRQALLTRARGQASRADRWAGRCRLGRSSIARPARADHRSV